MAKRLKKAHRLVVCCGSPKLHGLAGLCLPAGRPMHVSASPINPPAPLVYTLAVIRATWAEQRQSLLFTPLTRRDRRVISDTHHHPLLRTRIPHAYQTGYVQLHDEACVSGCRGHGRDVAPAIDRQVRQAAVEGGVVSVQARSGHRCWYAQDTRTNLMYTVEKTKRPRTPATLRQGPGYKQVARINRPGHGELTDVKSSGYLTS